LKYGPIKINLFAVWIINSAW